MLRATEHLRFHKIHDDLYVYWNRFFPNVVKLNKEASQLLQDSGKSLREKNDTTTNHYRQVLLKYKLLYEGEVDPYHDEFNNQIEAQYRLANQKADEFYQKKQEYSQLYIYNTSCNLRCPYCARRYKRHHSSANFTFKEREHILNLMLDQYIERKVQNGVKPINVSFNGGEIFLEWSLIKSSVERLKKIYSDLEFRYFVNTNMTLLTEEIASFISKHDFNLDISIDGYKAAHDETRQYHDGSGSFENVIRALQIYRKTNKNDLIDSFQGAIDKPDTFQPEEVYKMTRFGFKKARLGVNLLNVSEEDARKKAKIYGSFFDLNTRNEFQVSDSIFENFVQLVNLEENVFYFVCNGLSCLPRMGVYIDISAMRISQICGYVPGATVSLKEINYDIYNPVLWEVSKNFLRDRIESLKENCMECDLIGICKGGCVLRGIDSENKKNPAACVFQKEAWKIFLNHLCRNDMNGNNDGEEQKINGIADRPL